MRIALKALARRRATTSNRNRGNLEFQDVTEESGLVHTGWAQGVCAGDVNNDGHVDLLITHWGNNVLYRNQGDGTFQDETKARGVVSADAALEHRLLVL